MLSLLKQISLLGQHNDPIFPRWHGHVSAHKSEPKMEFRDSRGLCTIPPTLEGQRPCLTPCFDQAHSSSSKFAMTCWICCCFVVQVVLPDNSDFIDAFGDIEHDIYLMLVALRCAHFLPSYLEVGIANPFDNTNVCLLQALIKSIV